MKLEDMAYANILKLGKAHFLSIVLVELAETLYQDFPTDVGTDIKEINQHGLYELAKSIEERRGEQERDQFLAEVSALKKFLRPEPVKPKAKPAAKPKAKAKK